MFNFKRGNGLAWVIVIIAILIILFLVFRGGDKTNTEDMSGDTTVTEDGVTLVTYTNDGFVPKEVTINAGETVRFVNESNREMWVASAVHPTHEVFSGTSLDEHCPDLENDDFDQCEGGDTFEFTFNEAGEWAYHNHLGANHFGKVIVK